MTVTEKGSVVKQTLFNTLARAAAVAFLAAPGWTAAAQDRPNIIFVLADDLGYGDLGSYGQKRIKTPRLDRMASEGMRFTQFYAGSTVCAPSRSALMQGLHTGHCRVRGNAGRNNPAIQALRAEDVTVAEVLKRAGYSTALIGKWGLGDVGEAESGLPRKKGFDYFYGYLNQRHAHNYYPTHLWRNEARVKLANTVPEEDPDGAGVSDNKAEYSHDLITSEALEFVRRSRGGPFFLYFSPTLPHANNEARDQGMEVPELGEYRGHAWPAAQKAHAAMITRLDRDVGRLLDLLKELGIDSRTIVFFSSDNGPHREGGHDPDFNDSNGPLRGIKRDLYEGGIRVPLIVRWPERIRPGTTSDLIGAFWDFLPTAAELAGARAPENLDGISILPTLLGQRQSRLHEYLYWEFFERGFQQAVRMGNWKAVSPGSGQALELYDLPADAGETRNVAGSHPEAVRRVEKILSEARVDSSDWPRP